MILTNKKFKSYLFLIPYLVYFSILLIYFVYYESYGFFYQEKSSLFIFSFDFLHENLKQPGGFVMWLGKFFSTFYHSPIAGAIILSAFMTLIVILATTILSSLNEGKTVVIPLIIGVSLFYLNTDYHFLLFNTLGILFQMLLFYLLIRYPSFLRGWLPVLLAPLSYYLTGGFTWLFLLFMSLYSIFDKEDNRWIRILAMWGISFMTFYISKEFLFPQSVKTLIIFPFSDKLKGSQQILYLLVAGIISTLPALAKIKIRISQKLRIPEFSISLVFSFLMATIIIIIGLKRFDLKTKQYFLVEKLFYEEKYDEVIAFNTQNPPSNLLTVFLNNIALCETGKLGDNLFHSPQNPDGRTLFLKWDMVEEILKRGGYFYYTIGMINEAHRWAFENMVMKGQSPEGLKMLIRTDLINGNYEVASAYINLLKRTLFYREDAKKFEKFLFSDTALNADKELGRKRLTKVENDFFTITEDPNTNLEIILSSDSLNRKAFEYKLAYMLLKKNFKGIADALPEFEKIGFDRLPVHIEEAALALAVTNRGNLPYTGHLKISLNTEQRWNQYLGILRQYRNDVRSAEPALRKEFGDTFWYYVFYR
jgi:hypothetical protein